ncbi:SDR family oxidoreductase [Dehalogenimonas sp. THU2]|uniref:SDR family NAD(P)-dependent oxidoreductase n=1 Tax=Dehalogenimonas sp. THU2 TaxID=3151121 RepID=UPI00321862CA
MIIDNAGLDPETLGGNVAVVAGAGHGIGRETARALARIGAQIVAVDKDAVSGGETVRFIEQGGGSGIFVQADITDTDQVAGVFRESVRVFGKVDIVVDNLAFHQRNHQPDSHPLIDQFLPDILKRRYGVIVVLQTNEVESQVTEKSLQMLINRLNREAPGKGMVSLLAFIADSTPGGEKVDPELASAGLAGAIRFADKFHGVTIDYIAGLSKLGLDSQGQPIIPDEPPAEKASGSAGSIAQALEEVMTDFEAEYERLSILVRPVAKRMFQQGTGLKVDEWRVYAGEMSRVLTTGVPDDVKVAEYLNKLGRLRDYLAKQEIEAPNWFKDPDDLVAVLESLAFRKQVVADLIVALESATR